MADPVTIGLIVGGTVLQGIGMMQAGKAAAAAGQAQQQAKNYEAKQAEINAGQERAASQRESIRRRRQETMIQSQLQARAAASGGGATDPTIVTLAEDIAAEGEYSALTALYEGEDRARALESGATLSRYEGGVAAAAGKAKQKAYTISAIGSALTGAGSLYGKYGGTGSTSPGAGFDASIDDRYSWNGYG